MHQHKPCLYGTGDKAVCLLLQLTLPSVADRHSTLLHAYAAPRHERKLMKGCWWKQSHAASAYL
jgi:hypothetical protein